MRSQAWMHFALEMSGTSTNCILRPDCTLASGGFRRAQFQSVFSRCGSFKAHIIFCIIKQEIIILQWLYECYTYMLHLFSCWTYIHYFGLLQTEWFPIFSIFGVIFISTNLYIIFSYLFLFGMLSHYIIISRGMSENLNVYRAFDVDRCADTNL